jgi:4-hydroxybenzoate polyprenyltransferase
MSDQTPLPDQDNQSVIITTPAPPAAGQETRPVKGGSNNTAWIGGVILIALGVIFLLQNVRGFYLNNWWALFILIPALGSFADAWNIYRQQGRVSRRVRGALVSGCVFLLITATFLFNWNWGIVLPVLLIIWGITMLLNSLLPE